DKPVALGAIVSADGYVLTKLSELKAPIKCRLPDGKDVAAYVYGVHPDTDLALLKVEGDNLPVIPWTTEDSLDIGNWLATVKDEVRPLGVGVVGVNARLIKPQSGFMGVNLSQTDRGVAITRVTADSPAQKGGLARGDVVIKVNGESFTKIDKLIPRVKSFPPGEEIRLTVLRDGNEIVADVVLGEERSLNPLYERSNQQNTMGGNRLSKRRQNFPLAVQHDTFLKPEDCGGPVVDVNGKVVGINIARQGRVASLMLPASLAQKVVDDLKTGQWAPAVVHKNRIDEINRTLQDLTTQVALSPMNNDDLKKKIKDLSEEEKSLRDKLEEVYRGRLRAEWEIEQATKTFDSAQSKIERLQKEREKLVNGTK
ncbi:MAG: PDZ domain-containing protein, partial [Planctomycetaceae bacterium]|nr:PDZ domain-containing protein [Planctomycetaceae bacterium]